VWFGSRKKSLTAENSLVSGNSLSLTGEKIPLTQWWWTLRRRRMEARGRRSRWRWRRGSRRLEEDVEALDKVLLNVENWNPSPGCDSP